jgi:hypothetical protein
MPPSAGNPYGNAPSPLSPFPGFNPGKNNFHVEIKIIS